MKKIISNTHHISFESFIISFKDLIKKFESYIKTSRLTSKDKKSKNRPIFIFIDKLKRDYKQKSNYWLYKLFKELCINFEIITISSFTDDKIKTNDFVLFLDDCIYSGQQMSESIFNLKVENDKKFTFFILCSFMTRKGTERIIEAVLKNKLFVEIIVGFSENRCQAK